MKDKWSPTLVVYVWFGNVWSLLVSQLDITKLFLHSLSRGKKY